MIKQTRALWRSLKIKTTIALTSLVAPNTQVALVTQSTAVCQNVTLQMSLIDLCAMTWTVHVKRMALIQKFATQCAE